MGDRHERGSHFGNNGRSPEARWSPLACTTAEALREFGIGDRAVGAAVQAFVGGVEDLREPATLGLVYRDEGASRPALDVFVVWSSPLDLTSERSEAELARLGDLHGRFAEAIDPHLDSFLDLVDPGAYPTVADFAAALEKYAADARRGRLLACKPIEHPLAVRR